MHVFFDPIQKMHAPETFLVSGIWRACPEVPARVDRFRGGECGTGRSLQAT